MNRNESVCVTPWTALLTERLKSDYVLFNHRKGFARSARDLFGQNRTVRKLATRFLVDRRDQRTQSLQQQCSLRLRTDVVFADDAAHVQLGCNEHLQREAAAKNAPSRGSRRSAVSRCGPRREST